MKKEFCLHCGQPIMKHRHHFSRCLAEILLVIAEKYLPLEPFNIQQDLNFLSKNQYTNVQRLKYWDLLEKHFIGPEHLRMGRKWHLTERARGLILGEIKVPLWVDVFNDSIAETSSESIGLHDAVGDFVPPETWARLARPMRFSDEFQHEFLLKA